MVLSSQLGTTVTYRSGQSSLEASMSRNASRRRVLRYSGLAVASGLAGCGSLGGDSTDTTTPIGDAAAYDFVVTNRLADNEPSAELTFVVVKILDEETLEQERVYENSISVESGDERRITDAFERDETVAEWNVVVDLEMPGGTATFGRELLRGGVRFEPGGDRDPSNGVLFVTVMPLSTDTLYSFRRRVFVSAGTRKTPTDMGTPG